MTFRIVAGLNLSLMVLAIVPDPIGSAELIYRSIINSKPFSLFVQNVQNISLQHH